MKLKTVKLKEIVSMKYGIMPKPSIISENGYPIYSGYGVTGYAKQFLYKEPQLIVIARGVGGTGDVKISPENVWITNLSLVLELDKEKVDRTYLYYKLKKEPLKKNLNTGAAQAQITIGVLENYKVTIPELAIQKRISSNIASYDDLIDTNRRRIKLLEEAARLLFREWFVYFRFPGLEKVKIVDGVPEGWKKVPLSELVDFKEGPGLRNYQFRDEGIPFLNIRTFGDDEIDFSKVGYLDETEVYEKYKHFLLKEDDHVISSSGTLGRLVTIRASHLPLMLNTSLIRMRPKQPMKKWMLKSYLLYGGFIEKASSLAIGAAQLNFGPAHLNKMTILFPKNSETVNKFEKLISEIYLAKKNLLDQNQKLTQARDLLLPRLMSGEIEV